MLTEGHGNIVPSTLWLLFIRVVAGLSLHHGINEPRRQIKLKAPWAQAVVVVSLKWRGAIDCKGDPPLLTQPFKRLTASVFIPVQTPLQFSLHKPRTGTVRLHSR